MNTKVNRPQNVISSKVVLQQFNKYTRFFIQEISKLNKNNTNTFISAEVRRRSLIDILTGKRIPLVIRKSNGNFMKLPEIKTNNIKRIENIKNIIIKNIMYDLSIFAGDYELLKSKLGTFFNDKLKRETIDKKFGNKYISLLGYNREQYTIKRAEVFSYTKNASTYNAEDIRYAAKIVFNRNNSPSMDRTIYVILSPDTDININNKTSVKVNELLKEEMLFTPNMSYVHQGKKMATDAIEGYPKR